MLCRIGSSAVSLLQQNFYATFLELPTNVSYLSGQSSHIAVDTKNLDFANSRARVLALWTVKLPLAQNVDNRKGTVSRQRLIILSAMLRVYHTASVIPRDTALNCITHGSP